MDHTGFRTTFDTPPFPHKITYQHKLLFMGSCFTEHIGRRMEKFGFQVKVNPQGILFNPISIVDGLTFINGTHAFNESELFHHDTKWISFYHHSSFSSKDKTQTYNQIQSEITDARGYLHPEGMLFLTFGTAWVYKWKETGQIVANCHKIPNHHFNKELLEVSEIVLYYEKLLESLWIRYPNLKVVFTLSPVRHWKDGVAQNQVSKSTLRLAIYKLCEMYEQAFYFPAYEWIMDDLRDYRFYALDMLHPNELAIEYIWEKFDEMYFGEETREKYKEIEKLQRFLAHNPSDPEDSKYLVKLEETKERLNGLLDQS